MKKILVEKLPKITKNKKRLSKLLDLKITNRGKEIFIEGSAEEEFMGQKVIEALDFGFPYSHIHILKKDNLDFETINIKEYTPRKNLSSIRARIIGKNGKAIKTLADLTNCYIELNENKIGIIGTLENIERATKALILLIQGSKHGNVYKCLEKNQLKPIYDLGLRNED
ncbi:MAG: KH domain-containing protein [Nanoarchaeota archaeon]|nr:KH domain-containing protein [Nanoarchaeota archaeon]